MLRRAALRTEQVPTERVPRSLRSELADAGRCSLALVWGAGRREFLIAASIQFVTAVAVAVQILLAREVVTTVVATQHLGGSIVWVAVIIGMLAVLNVARVVQNEQSRLLGELVARRAMASVIAVATSLELVEFESDTFYDRLHRAQLQGQSRAFQMVTAIIGVSGAAMASAAILIALGSMNLLLLPLAIVGYLPLAVATRLNARDNYTYATSMTARDRKRAYIQSLMLDRETAQEVRAYTTAPYLLKLYNNLYDIRISELRRLVHRRALRATAGAASGYLLTSAVFGSLSLLYATGRIGIGTASASAYGLMQLGTRIQAVQAGSASLYESILFLRDYRSFVATGRPHKINAPAAPSKQLDVLRAEHVTFSYPDSSIPALKDVSLEIRRREIVALVGENGSGKSTLAKLLAGLYSADLGQILWNGIDIRLLDAEQLRNRIAITFQNFERYRLTVRENIGMGRHEALNDAVAVSRVATQAGVDEFVRSLRDGYDTVLAREFMGGHEISLGQWQRVALARALFRNADLVVLDEPSAALDARIESQLFADIRRLANDRAVLIISHRLSTVRGADRIYYLQGGRITERGTHSELMADAGAYAELFNLQASAYVVPASPSPVSAA